MKCECCEVEIQDAYIEAEGKILCEDCFYEMDINDVIDFFDITKWDILNCYLDWSLNSVSGDEAQRIYDDMWGK